MLILLLVRHKALKLEVSRYSPIWKSVSVAKSSSVGMAGCKEDVRYGKSEERDAMNSRSLYHQSAVCTS